MNAHSCAPPEALLLLLNGLRATAATSGIKERKEQKIQFKTNILSYFIYITEAVQLGFFRNVLLPKNLNKIFFYKEISLKKDLNALQQV